MGLATNLTLLNFGSCINDTVSQIPIRPVYNRPTQRNMLAYATESATIGISFIIIIN